MDSLRENSGKKWAQLIATAVFALVFLLPIAFFIQQALFSEAARADSFWDGKSLQIIFLTLGRTLLQAIASTLLTLISGVTLGLLLVFGQFPSKKSIQSAVEILGSFCFVLPGVSVVCASFRKDFSADSISGLFCDCLCARVYEFFVCWNSVLLFDFAMVAEGRPGSD